ncbi:chemotaxis sensory transducer [Bifidobacterium pseudolongum subsp. globosum]|uniref:DUF6591 domain-containing protein n=1 Tax=Bifidobacterium pseudolongum TaxID=1694 RepID=UPI00101FDAE3|nr:DUF6591 domain-containing protein [Bifidobacterium pseudolongum]RYQ17983.1 chemotaxis sensory transducer [Bifidobacterium pseudolongum subsp. globosum]
MQRAQSKKTAWIIGIIGVVVAVVAACVAVFVFYLPQRGAEPQASAETAAEASPSPSESTKVTPSTTDPMEVIRNYEDFMMKYADFAEMLNSQDGMPASKAEEYTDWLASFDDMMAQFDAVSNSKLTPEQEKYFDEVIDKVDKRMKEATGSELAGIPRSAEEAEKQVEERQKEADRTAGRTSSDGADSDAASSN